MRPEKIRRLLNKGIQEYLLYGNVNQIKECMPGLKKLYNQYVKDEGDTRSGEETYGYGDAESIYNDMMYISDRWRCAYRLRWIIDGIENGKIITIQKDKENDCKTSI